MQYSQTISKAKPKSGDTPTEETKTEVELGTAEVTDSEGKDEQKRFRFENSQEDTDQIKDSLKRKIEKINEDKEEKRREVRESEGNKSAVGTAVETANNSNDSINVPGKMERRIYRECEFVFKKIPGDGYCMVNAVLKGLEAQIDNPPEFKTIIKQIAPAFQKDIEKYSSAIELTDTDPIRDIQTYTRTGTYSSSIVDFIFPILADMLNTTIIVLVHKKETKTYKVRGDQYIFQPTRSEGEREVYVLLQRDHYDSLIPKSIIREDGGGSNKDSQKETSKGNPTLGNEKAGKNKRRSQNEEVELFCVCKSDDGSRFMMSCDKCLKWYHPGCVDYTCKECTDKAKVVDDTATQCQRDEIKQLKTDAKVMKRKNEDNEKSLKQTERDLKALEKEHDKLKRKTGTEKQKEVKKATEEIKRQQKEAEKKLASTEEQLKEKEEALVSKEEELK